MIPPARRAAPMNAIDILDVSKSFGSHRAVRQLTLSVPSGSIYGFIGPNGSGKTTTIRMILNILVPDRGTIKVLGQPARLVRDDLGYLPEERGLYKHMTVRQVLRYYGQLKGRARRDLDEAIDTWLGRLNLTPWAHARVQTLSKGMAQTVQFIATIVSRPRLLVLDEPFSGLDPLKAEQLREAILELRQSGTTIVLSTHDMHVAERLCDRIFMIFRGRKVLDGSMADIHHQFGQDVIRVRTRHGRRALAALPGIHVVADTPSYQDVRLDHDPQQFLRALAEITEVYHFEMKHPSLHDLFVRLARPTPEELAQDEAESA
jgi:ABC-2 type transport system ATP-binding protein